MCVCVFSTLCTDITAVVDEGTGDRSKTEKDRLKTAANFFSCSCVCARDMQH